MTDAVILSKLDGIEKMLSNIEGHLNRIARALVFNTLCVNLGVCNTK